MPQRFWRKIAASSVIFSMLFLPTMQTAHAASTDISDIPIAVKNQVAANIMFTLDDSGSMQFEVVPENNEVYFFVPPPESLIWRCVGVRQQLQPCRAI